MEEGGLHYDAVAWGVQEKRSTFRGRFVVERKSTTGGGERGTGLSPSEVVRGAGHAFKVRRKRKKNG